MTESIWRKLAEALARWSAVGRKPSFWLRDDDAIEPTPALDRLVEITGHFDVPLGLAVIPKHARPELARHLRNERHVTALVHGWSHDNFAPDGAKKQELGPHRPAGVVLGDLAHAIGCIEELFGAQSWPLLVPPWNRVDAALLPSLAGVGYRGLSVFGRPKPAPLAVLNTTVDIIDWHGTRGCRDHAGLVGEVVVQLDAGLAGPSPMPVGLLTHHLVHDEPAWVFMRKLFEMTRPDCRWHSVGELLDR